MNTKILGIYVGINDVDNVNWQTLIDKLTNQFNKHKTRNLTLKGRAIIANTKVMSLLWYKATIINIPTKHIKQIDILLRSFMWNNRMHLIRQEVLNYLLSNVVKI